MNGKQVLNVSFKEDIDRTVNILLVLNVLTICIVLHVVVPTEVEGDVVYNSFRANVHPPHVW